MVRTGEAINVCRLDLWIDPIFDEVIQQELRVKVSELPAREFDDITAMGLSKAHAYHVSAAKDELPRQWWVTAQLLAQCSQLLCVSSGGAGFDTVDVEACTKAGVAVVNQEGANAASVAEL
ncbi:hypothetical protein [Pseudomonas sp. EpS/L25]|uniref:hypothetical protein n=1 Tax=Pseudomonas sp. EpS/L25 TaxID=1749078 RepID=UPI0009EBE53D|nr:hypothetical protein [Pseudomonas sp. EpS/L25]